MGKPTVLLGMINDAAMSQTVAACLEYHGFEVVNFALDSLDFRYPNLRSRLAVLLKKTLGNRQAKKELMVELKRRQVQTAWNAHPQFDYALFIRADIYPDSFLREVRHRSRVMVNYQWDGVARFAAAQAQIGLFDRYYAFDPADIRADSRLLPATSFYFDHDLSGLAPYNPAAPRFYFVGSHRADRLDDIRRFCRYAQQAGWQLDFHIVNPNQPEAAQDYPFDGVYFADDVPFADNLERARRSSVLVDFVISTHSGLSLRTFEALGYRKKLITTNAEIEKYDFYHPDNIFIWRGGSLDGLQAFIARPYHELPQEIYQKYSFGNWVRYVLDIEPHIKISLPTD